MKLKSGTSPDFLHLPDCSQVHVVQYVIIFESVMALKLFGYSRVINPEVEV
jgi:hypothetical protein